MNTYSNIPLCVGCSAPSRDRLFSDVDIHSDAQRMYAICDTCYESRYTSLDRYYAPNNPLAEFVRRTESRLVFDKQDCTEKAKRLMGEEIFNLGGQLSGGTALSILTGSTFHQGDIDIFFVNANNYSEALAITGTKDLCRPKHLCFVGHSPVFARFDLTVNMCSISKMSIQIDQRCLNAIETGVCRVLHHNVVKPTRTLKRIQKYRNRGYFVPEQDALQLLYRIGCSGLTPA